MIDHKFMGGAAPCAVLWDMDGVLVDSGEFHYQSWKLALSEMGVPFDREVFRCTFGMNNTGVIGTLIPGAEAALIAHLGDRKEALFREAIRGKIEAMPGVMDWLEELQRQGVRMALASSAPQANIDAIVEELGIGSFFGAIVSAAEMPGKPDPAVFLEAARRLGCVPGECVVIEDAVAGVEAARRAGMRCIAVTTTNPASALVDADLIVEGLAGVDFEAVFGKP